MGLCVRGVWGGVIWGGSCERIIVGQPREVRLPVFVLLLYGLEGGKSYSIPLARMGRWNGGILPYSSAEKKGLLRAISWTKQTGERLADGQDVTDRVTVPYGCADGLKWRCCSLEKTEKSGP